MLPLFGSGSYSHSLALAPPRHTLKAMCSKGQLWAETQRANRVEALRTLIAKEIGESDTITLEIGCGHGHWLTAYGAEHTNEKCVGIDLLNDRLKKCEAKRAKRGLTNVHFMKAEASEFLDAIAPHVRLAKIFILYPDPWPKARQSKNRFIQPENLTRLANIALPNCTLCFRTDHEDYHLWTREKLLAHPDWKVLPGAPWPFEAATFFQNLLRDKRDCLAVRS